MAFAHKHHGRPSLATAKLIVTWPF